jgi:hypothetical protein
MSFTRKEAAELARRKKVRREAEREPYYRSLAQAEVGAKQLTNDATWNWFLQILSYKKEEAEAALRLIDEGARASFDFSLENLSRVQGSRLSLQSRVDTLVEVMETPAQILSDAAQAEERRKSLNYAESEEKIDSLAAS